MEHRTILCEMIVEIVIGSDCEEERIFVPDAIYEIIIVIAVGFKEGISQEYIGSGEVAGRDIGGEAVDDAIIERGLHQGVGNDSGFGGHEMLQK